MLVLYTVEGPNLPSGEVVWPADQIDDARHFAQVHEMALIELQYAFSDSELVEDYGTVFR